MFPNMFSTRRRTDNITWEFPKLRGTVFWDPYNKDPTIQGTILGSPIFGNSHLGLIRLGPRSAA